MDNKTNKRDFYVFDGGPQTEKQNESAANNQFGGILRNRYVIMGVVFCIMGAMILAMTASLQFSGAAVNTEQQEGQIPRSYIVEAPRGEITDINDVVYATSEEVNTLLLAYSGYIGLVDKEDERVYNDELNAMLLDLSYLLERYNATPVTDLSDYLQVEPYLFLKEDEEILKWQVNKNLFELTEPGAQEEVSYQDNLAKMDPLKFFLYLRKERFSIDENYSPQEAYRICLLRYQLMKDNWAFLRQGKPVKIATDVPQQLIDILLEQNYKYKGILAGKEYRRVYSPQAADASHVLGYVGNISQEEYLNQQNFGYQPTDIVGKAGIESQMERFLHGMAGEMPYNIISRDQESWEFFPEDIGIAPSTGAKVRLTLDSKLQKATKDALEKHILSKADEGIFAGGAVAMNPKTGEIYAMVSYPDFDPQNFVLSMQGDLEAQDKVREYLSLPSDDVVIDSEETEEESRMPLWNRTIASFYAPGSTFKMMTAVAGLETGAMISPTNTFIECSSPMSGVEVGERELFCLERPHVGHGPIDLQTALAESCNIYFAQLGVQTTINEIDKWGKQLGLGELTSIDLPGEVRGIRANREYKRLTRPNAEDQEWKPADTAQAAFGQSDNAFSLIQLARYTAAMYTNELVTPHVVKDVTAESGEVLYTPLNLRTPVGMSDSTMQLIQQGMASVVNSTEGTAYNSLGFFERLGVPVAGKTGSAQTERKNADGDDVYNGLFVCAAPADDPQIVIAIIVEKEERGSNTINIAKSMLLSYFELVDPEAESNVADAAIGDVMNATPVSVR